MSNSIELNTRDGVIDEWMGWLHSVPPLGPVALASGLALVGSVLTYSNIPEWASGLFSLSVLILLGWGSNLGMKSWLAKKESTTTASLLLVAVAAVQAYSTFLVLPVTWGSLKLAGYFLAGVPLVGAGFIWLPLVLKKILLLLLLCFHFGGIMTAVTAVDPPGAPGPWLSGYLWANVYRPYLQFFYMNNAYHFYSPEPGPPVLVWFRIDYTNNTSVWYKIPNNEKNIPLLYFRQLSLTELGTNQAMSFFPNNLDQLVGLRNAAGISHDPMIPALPTDLHPGSAFRQPQERMIKAMGSYTRHISKMFPHPEGDPTATVKSIRLYRVTHKILSQQQMKSGLDPKDPSTYLPYFYGDYDRDGNLLRPDDPFLWFSFPIYNEAEEKMRSPDGLVPSVLDYFKLHSGLDISKEKF